ncbi:hypothetical protein UFOVP124_5 [uncultured Caudovirales phage]|uniref:Uncharacterized protein n=1 Tax=uncultured Caudovirales phage TaxID=2100421 RepID=A0A6J5L915_9CAUD|nr:hypothetical protein UFOVP124_5 [uncultured Caudovirales phage]
MNFYFEELLRFLGIYMILGIVRPLAHFLYWILHPKKES